jgi:hypothetical protein
MPKPIENAHATYSSQIEINKRKKVISATSKYSAGSLSVNGDLFKSSPCYRDK